MAMVNTVTGPMSTDDLGFTLMHEHVMVSASGLFDCHPDLFGPDPRAIAIEALKQAKEGGVDTMVDATTFDLGRKAPLLREVSEASGINIINVTGWWLDVPRFLVGVSIDQMAAEFIRDVRDGFRGTDIKAGLLKCAADSEGVTPPLEVMCRAVARAHHETGLPIMVHSFPTGQVGRRQIAIFKEEGVDLSRVKIDHSNDTTDVEYLKWILDQGCYLGLDRYPGRLVSPHMRTVTMKKLIDEGYAEQLCPSHDCVCTGVLKQREDGTMPTEHVISGPNRHRFLYMKYEVIPELQEMGVADSVIDTLFRENPKRFLGTAA